MEPVTGAYLILFRLDEDKEVTVGGLGAFHFPSGWYTYTGSAMGGLEARVRRHLSPVKKLRWHIDYLLAEAVEAEALLLPSRKDVECRLNDVIGALPGSSTVVTGFGSSDCGCETHLHHLTSETVGCLRRCFPPELVRKRGQQWRARDIPTPNQVLAHEDEEPVTLERSVQI